MLKRVSVKIKKTDQDKKKQATQKKWWRVSISIKGL